MVKRNPHIIKLNAGYLFPEINKRKQAVLAKNPNAKLISLGIGDTTHPLDPFVTQCMSNYSQELSTLQGYTGYGPEQGNRDIRQRIADKFYPKSITSEDVFISDGAKCDIGRLQLLFGADATIAVQDPTYPVYVDTGVILGQSSGYDKEHAHYRGITYMRCTPENDFFPDLDKLPRTDLIYFCSPNNPTGSVATYEQLEKLVKFAKKNQSIIIFDAAYSSFIRSGHYPKSIYEIAGASDVAIEVNSFSKMAGFTGVRLGWSIVPEKLCFEDGSPVRNDWHRINTTFFNGASNVAQKAGMAVLADEGMLAVDRMVDYYMQNALKIRTALSELGFTSYGGVNAPFVWGKFPGKNSWEMFTDILEHAHVVTTPGSGFGPAGENFLRFSAFGQRAQVDEALERLKKHFNK
jgi:LL-diaminopimelate aminotransferase